MVNPVDQEAERGVEEVGYEREGLERWMRCTAEDTHKRRSILILRSAMEDTRSGR